jgi:hypothetical protein
MRGESRAVLAPLLLAALAAAASPATDLEIRLFNPTPPCAQGETGFSGEAARDGVSIRFWSCAHSIRRCHSKIATATGQPLSEILVEGAGGMRFWAAGIELRREEDLTEDQRIYISAVMNALEYEVVGELYDGLAELGIASSDPAVCLSYHMQAYEERRGR